MTFKGHCYAVKSLLHSINGTSMKTIAPFTHNAHGRKITNTATHVTVSVFKKTPLVLPLIRMDSEPDLSLYSPGTRSQSMFILGIDEQQILHTLHYSKENGWSRLAKSDTSKLLSLSQESIYRNPGNGDIQITNIAMTTNLNEAFFATFPELVYPSNTQVLNITLTELVEQSTRIEWNSTYNPLGKNTPQYLIQTDDVRLLWINHAQREVYDLTALFHNTDTRSKLNKILEKSSMKPKNKAFRYPDTVNGKFSTKVTSREALINDFFGSKYSVDMLETNYVVKHLSAAVSNNLAIYAITGLGMFARASFKREQKEILDRYLVNDNTSWTGLHMRTATAELYYFRNDPMGVYIRAKSTSRSATIKEDIKKEVPAIAKPTSDVIVSEATETLSAPQQSVCDLITAVPPTTADNFTPTVVNYEMGGDNTTDWGPGVLVARPLSGIEPQSFYMGADIVYSLPLGQTYRQVLWSKAGNSEMADRIHAIDSDFIVSTMTETWVKVGNLILYVGMHINPTV